MTNELDAKLQEAAEAGYEQIVNQNADVHKILVDLYERIKGVAYVRCGRNKSKAALAIKIHRNTFTRRSKLIS